MFYLKVQGYSIETAKQTTVTAKFDEKGILLNPRAVAQSSQFGWGKWQESKKIPCSFGCCYWCSTPGHGGYILVTQMEELPAFKDPVRVVDYGGRYKFKVFEFEEDCDWAILEYHDPKVRNHSLARLNRPKSTVSEVEYMKIVVATLKHYAPWVLEQKTVAC